MTWDISQTGLPAHPWVRVFINGQDVLALGTWRFVSLNFERNSAQIAGQFSIELFDENWTDLEALLFDGSGIPTIHFQYGWVDGAKSPLIRGKVTGISSRLDVSGITLTLTGANDAYGLVVTQKQEQFSGTAIHDIVRQVAEEEGYEIGLIEPTLMIPQTDEPTEHKKFDRGGQSFSQFMATLATYAVSAITNESGYVVHIEAEEDENSTSRGRLSFAPPRLLGEAQRTYTVFRDQMGDVISFEPEMQDLITIFAGYGGQTKTTTIDPLTKETVSTVYDPSESASDVPEGQDRTLYQREIEGQKTGRFQFFPSLSPKAIRARQQAHCDRVRRNFFQATMSIVGDPQIRAGIDSRVRVNVFTNQGALHYSSGVYWVQKITDQISGGEFTTSLELTRATARNAPHSVDPSDEEPRLER